MKRIALAILLALGGCAYDVTLLPRGDAPRAVGTANTGNKTISVQLDGETYAGDYVRGRVYGFGTTQGFVAGKMVTTTGTMSAASNQYSALLVGPRGQIRCEFMAESSGGNGVCVDNRDRTWDMLIKQQ